MAADVSDTRCVRARCASVETATRCARTRLRTTSLRKPPGHSPVALAVVAMRLEGGSSCAVQQSCSWLLASTAVCSRCMGCGCKAGVVEENVLKRCSSVDVFKLNSLQIATAAGTPRPCSFSLRPNIARAPTPRSLHTCRACLLPNTHHDPLFHLQLRVANSNI